MNLGTVLLTSGCVQIGEIADVLGTTIDKSVIAAELLEYRI